MHDITVVHTQLRNETEWQLVTKVFALYIRKHHAVIENIPRTPGRSLVKHCSCDFFSSLLTADLLMSQRPQTKINFRHARNIFRCQKLISVLLVGCLFRDCDI